MHLDVKPPATDAETLRTLLAEVAARVATATPADMAFARDVDEDELDVLKSEFFDARGLTHLWPDLGRDYDEFLDFILNQAKFAYPLKRPHALAKQLGVPFRRPANYIRARGSSYPSAHAASVWYVTYSVADALGPSARRALYDTAKRIAQSRLTAGVHTRQDIEEGRRLARAAVARKNASTGASDDGAWLTDELGDYLWYHGSREGLGKDATGFVSPGSSGAQYDATFFTNSRELAEGFTIPWDFTLVATCIKNVKLLDPDNLFVDLRGGDLSLTPEGRALFDHIAAVWDEAQVEGLFKSISRFEWGAFDTESRFYGDILDFLRDHGYRGWVEKELPRYGSSPVISVALLYPEEDTAVCWIHRATGDEGDED
jgi:hypothetical protein